MQCTYESIGVKAIIGGRVLTDGKYWLFVQVLFVSPTWWHNEVWIFEKEIGQQNYQLIYLISDQWKSLHNHTIYHYWLCILIRMIFHVTLVLIVLIYELLYYIRVFNKPSPAFIWTAEHIVKHCYGTWFRITQFTVWLGWGFAPPPPPSFKS